ARTNAGRVLSVSRFKRDCDFFADGIQLSASGTTFRLCSPDGDIDVKLALLGAAMVSNALLAAASAWAVGASLVDIAEGLASLTAVKGRLHLQVLPTMNLIDDSYNANPASVKAAIDVLASFSGRRVLVLGDMAELGAESESLHLEVGRYAAQSGIDHLLSCGNLSQHAAQGAGHIATHFLNKNALLADIQNQLQLGDSVLVKGSRSAGMDVVVKEIASTGVTGGNTPC
ncbi:MAG: UDP-N-acetylmuramoyl-tripeptide--D-alanyl-D-alanine ligase, partial [Paracoccaceae bacterium]